MSEARHSQLLKLLLSQGQMGVDAIAAVLGASPATIRRDLTALEAAGRIERQHGTARVATGSSREIAFEARQSERIVAKRAIAAAAAAHLQPDNAVFLDAATTVLELARHIRAIGIPLRAFTNSLAVAEALADAPGVTVTVIGGRLRPENRSMVGPAAVSMLQDLWCDQVFLGATAIDAGSVLTSHDAEEAVLNAAMLTRGASVHVLADHSKFDGRATHRVARLGPGQHIITDAPPPDTFTTTATTAGVTITVAPSLQNPEPTS